MSTSSDFKEFTLDSTSYANFDGLSLRQSIIDKLNASGVFTDQNYEGSNISSFIDIMSYTFHTLLFYLNKTSNEGMFSEAQIYENMSRIVKLIDYKPVGNQSAILNFLATASATLTNGNYTIPRYTYFKLNNIFYSFNSDASFSKLLTSTAEILSDFSEKNLLYQGKFIEYPILTAIGNEFETFTLNPGDNLLVDHFNIDIYVKYSTNMWEKWEKTDSLFLESATSKKFEIRLNENGRYEVKFGNGINGRKLNSGEQISIYYLQSDGTTGEVGVGELDGKTPILFKTTRFEDIKTYIYQNNSSIMTDNELKNVVFSNINVSSKFSAYENAASIKKYSPKTFQSQYRLVTKADFSSYIRNNFSNIVKDVTVANNSDFLSNHVKYLFDIGVSDPLSNDRISLNQLTFATSCNFNNVYVYVAPTIQNKSTNYQSYLNVAQKNLIMKNLTDKRLEGVEIVFQDPIYMGISLGLETSSTEVLTTAIADNMQLEIVVSDDSRKNSEQIIEEVFNVFYNNFKFENTILGQNIDIVSIYGDILAISGVEKVFITRLDVDYYIEGLSFLVYNPIYPTSDIKTIIKNLKLKDFQIPFFADLDNLRDKMVVVSSSESTK